MSNSSSSRPRSADPFKLTPERGSFIDWLGARRPATLIVIAMTVAVFAALIPAAFH